MKEFGCKGEVRLRFRLRMVSAGLLGDKERCGMCKDGKSEPCDEGVVRYCAFLVALESLLVIEVDYWV